MQEPEVQEGSTAGEITNLFSSVKEIFTEPENTTNRIILAGSVALGTLIVLLIIRALVSSRMKAFAERTKIRGDDLLAVIIQKMSLIFLLIVSMWPASYFLVISASVRRAHGKLLILALLYQAALWGNGIITFLLTPPADATDKQQATARILQSIGFLCRLGIWVIVILLALANLGFDISVLLAGGTIGGIAIAFAFQSILKDLFSSVSILLDKPFEVGDFIVVGDMKGTVERIGLQSSRVRSITGEQLIFHNGDLVSSRIRNYKRMQERRSLFTIGVVYGTPSAKLEAIPGMIEAIISGEEQARFDRSHFSAFAASSLDFETVYYVSVADYQTYMDIQQRINLALVKRFEDEGIEFAYPTQTIHLEGSPAPS